MTVKVRFNFFGNPQQESPRALEVPLSKLAIKVSLLLLVILSATALAANTIKVGDAGSGITILGQDPTGLTVRVDVGELELIPVATKAGQFVMLSSKELQLSQRVGEPALPVANELIAVPVGAELRTEVLASETVEYNLADYGVTDRIIPAQPSLSKSDNPDFVPFEFKADVYAKAGYQALPVSSATIEGTMRGLRVGFISVAPVEYDPVANRIRVQKQITVRVNFDSPDWQATEKLFNDKYSPAFEAVYAQLANYPMLGVGEEKTDLTKYPIKMVIVSARMFESQLQPFIAWKIKKGFKVIVAYTDVIGSTTTAIKTYLQGIYNAGTVEDPAPSFVLFVGDTPQIPAWTGSAASHETDLRYCEFTGDNIPEIYYGRFSAQNTGQLQPQIDKTLEYERYLMPNPAYLSEVTLVSGVDASYAPTYGNGQLNYGTNLYFNAAHGITPHVWLYPASDAAGASAAIIASVNSGVGLANYTAHCGHEGWGDPSFTVSDINSLTNIHEYGLGIGNCCLSSTYDESTPCFGEAWMQGANKGGVGYIGASNNTYWDEDYWWGVGGGKAVVAAGPAYDATKLGAYDGMFHDHGEPVSSHYVTNYAINMAGCLAVQQSTSSRKQYYWEAYNLLGDPSVAAYLKVPTANSVSYAGSLLMTATTFTVLADAGSYVGISANGVLHGAGYVDQSGSVQIAVTPFDQPVTADVVVTAQNKIPYIGTVQVIAPEGPYVIYQSHAVNDAAGNGDGLVDFGESIVLGVQLQNVGPDNAQNVVATLSSADGYVTITDATENYGTITGNFGNVNIANAFAFTVSPTAPDGHKVTFDLSVSGTEKDTWNSQFIITLHAPNVVYVSFAVSDPTGNNNGMIDPGETADVVVTLQNTGTGVALNTTASISELDDYVTISDANGTFGTIAAGGGSASNSGDVFTVSAQASTPMGHAVNCKLDLVGSGGFATTLYFSITIGDRVVFFLEDFTVEQGWTGLGGASEWQIGPAIGGTGGSGSPDPSDDHTAGPENMILGNDLTSAGSYNAGIGSTNWVYSPVIDCSNATGIFLTYYHQLGCESSSYDHAYLEVWDGTAWIQLYANGATNSESQWTESVYDLGQSADANPEFQIRFGLGPTDGSVQYNGWSIDDISLKGYVSGSGGTASVQMVTTALVDSLVEAATHVKNVVVRNIGQATLRIRFTPAVSWMTCASANNYIPIGDSLIFPVTFNATGLTPGNHDGLLNYASNDPVHVTGSLNASLHVYAPQITVVPAAISKSIPVGGVDSTLVTVNNTGMGRLTYQLACEFYGKPAFARPVADATSTPIGYRIDESDKGTVEEPYFSEVTKGSGGPDLAGHIWVDSDDPQGPDYQWIDIAATGTNIAGLTDDNFVGPFPIGFSFPYYGSMYTEFYVSGNGYIGFGPNTSYGDRNNVAMPTAAAPNNIIAWCWDDLNIADVDNPGGRVVYQVVEGNLVVSFLNYPEYESATNPGDVITAQVILLADGNVKIQYQSIAAGFDVLGCTIGMENAAGTDGLQVAYNAAYLHNQLAILLGDPIPTWMDLHVNGGTIAPNSSGSFWVYFDALEMVDSTCGGSLEISSNDPAQPLIDLPVTLRVGATYMAGDADNNQLVNISDAVYLIGYIFSGGPAPDPLEAGDADCSGAVNISDAVYLINYVFSGGPAPCAK